ncbi:hypothetical protein HPB50_006526 [Hyalomma asiaticum]|uniref:Uncharacterized protein n=1 Tax=Hyalomma asiaticum TaxID=266040 RepID=A0ACB7RST8_HYAAI|nr:hypothetical protein HPB50_006526 [Hyalomma asiaticum]
MPEREESDRSHPPAASPQPQNRRQEQHQHSTKVSSARNAAAPPQHHDRRPVPAQPTSVDQPPATAPPGRSQNVSTWTSEGRSESRRIGGAAAQRDSPGHDAKDGPGQGFANWLLQVATNNRSGGAYEGATRTTGLPKPAAKMAAIPEPAATTAPAAIYRSQVRPRRQQRQDQRQQRRQGLQQKRRRRCRRWLRRLWRCRMAWKIVVKYIRISIYTCSMVRLLSNYGRLYAADGHEHDTSELLFCLCYGLDDSGESRVQLFFVFEDWEKG